MLKRRLPQAKGLDDKRPKHFSPDGEAQKSPTVISMDFPKKFPDALPTFDGAT